MYLSATFPSFGRRYSRLADFHPFVGGTPAGVARGTQPRTAIEQDDRSYTLRFDVPGIGREHLSIGIEANIVRILSLEGAPRRYQAAYELPQEIEVATSSAKLEHGVLTVRLVKQHGANRVTELAIN